MRTCSDRGAGVVQYAALLVVAGGLVGALAATDVPATVETHAGRALCAMFRTDSGCGGAKPKTHVPATFTVNKATTTGGTDCRVDGGRQDPCLQPIDWGEKISDTDSTEKGNEDILDSKLLADCGAVTNDDDTRTEEEKAKAKANAEKNGTGKTKHLDACTFEPDGDLGTFWRWDDIGQPVTNCPHGDFHPTTNTTGILSWNQTYSTEISHEKTTGWSISVGPLSFGDTKTTTDSHTNTATTSTSLSVDVPPGRKVALTGGVEYRRVRGRFRLNYDTRVNGHYIWYANYVELAVPTGRTQVGMEDLTCDQKFMNGR
ncbi:hypothetical protein BTM25_28740 [Actinomadura rubteroloni]|uniref:Uncharacterized protein n=1 Tax=Actinomadura rubteroloni TaxID=1926885 RepID=A0A2P4UGW0_9ACTN|nr:hypothetical protein [Actinomadura rubteroloni]POM24246.1 hypothetical protein BTM25_28740 [Actinomadura rubteroloni]